MRIWFAIILLGITLLLTEFSLHVIGMRVTIIENKLKIK